VPLSGLRQSNNSFSFLVEAIRQSIDRLTERGILSPKRKFEDVFLKKLLQEALDPVDAVELQKQVAPHDPQHSDVFCRPRPTVLPKRSSPTSESYTA